MKQKPSPMILMVVYCTIMTVLLIGLVLLFSSCTANTSRAESTAEQYAANNFPGWEVIHISCEQYDSNNNGRVRCNLSVRDNETGTIQTPGIECPSSWIPQRAKECQVPFN